ncbi:cyclase, partial [Streptomyces sp. DH10]|nr:cyclase [Streptomyces sp. DH10]
QRFKQYIEKRGGESGAWRGRIQPGGDTGPTPL